MLIKTKLLNLHRVSIRLLRMNSTRTNIAVCQLTATNDKNKNLQTVRKLVAEAVSKNAKMVFFPEASDFVGTSKQETKDLAEKLKGPTMSEYQNLAKQNRIWLSMGGVHEIPEHTEDRTRLYNAHVLIDENGNIASVYRKLHLFDTCIESKNIRLRESDNVIGGPSIVAPTPTPAGHLGLSICYDLRFPELAIMLRKQGASILTYPSAFTHATGEAHWEVLLRARAIENQCYVIAAAQYGEHNKKRISHGRAMIVNPWGEIIAECPTYTKDTPTNESVAIATIDSDLLKKIREEMPVFEHRRNDVYDLKCLECTSLPIDDNETYAFSEKKIPGSTVFYKSKYSFAFTNIRCVVPGHVLIASLEPVNRLVNLTQDQLADLFQTASKVERAVEKMYNANASAVCVQDGKDAGQTIQHVHVHILPRRPGDFKRNDDIYEELAKHDKEGTTTPLRDISEMVNEAKELRKYFL